jgi:hypothetical protein
MQRRSGSGRGDSEEGRREKDGQRARREGVHSCECDVTRYFSSNFIFNFLVILKKKKARPSAQSKGDRVIEVMKSEST